MVSLELYNVHKRQTLDRLSGKYAFRTREILRKQTAKHLDEFVSAVKSDSGFHPNVDGLKSSLDRMFLDHEEDVIRVAVSDGVQEVSPENELNLWTRHPISTPIEITLSTDLAGFRDKFADKFIHRRRLVKSVSDFVTSVIDEYLRNIRKAYTRAAFDWLDHENEESPGVDDVIEGLKQAFQKTSNHAETVFRTETTNYFNESRQAYFATETAVDYAELYAVTDGRVSNICEDRHGFVITIQQAALPKYRPAFHPNCRTIQRPLISSLKSHAAIIERGLKMNEASFTPLPRGWG